MEQNKTRYLWFFLFGFSLSKLDTAYGHDIGYAIGEWMKGLFQ